MSKDEGLQKQQQELETIQADYWARLRNNEKAEEPKLTRIEEFRQQYLSGVLALCQLYKILLTADQKEDLQKMDVLQLQSIYFDVSAKKKWPEI